MRTEPPLVGVAPAAGAEADGAPGRVVDEKAEARDCEMGVAGRDGIPSQLPGATGRQVPGTAGAIKLGPAGETAPAGAGD